MKLDQLMFLKPGEGAVHNVLGSPYRVLLTGEQAGGAFALIEVTAPAGSAVPLHVHRREDETFFVLEGVMEAQTANHKLTLEKNATAFLPRNIPHSYRNPGSVPARYLVLITPAGFENCLLEFARLPANSPPDPARLVEIGSRYGLEFPAP